MLIPKVLGAIGKPFYLTYKVTRLAFRLSDTRSLLTAVDIVGAFLLDINGKAKLSLALLLIKIVHGKRRCSALASKTCDFLNTKLPPFAPDDVDKVLAFQLDTCLGSATTEHVDPLTHAGLLFLRDCLYKRKYGDDEERNRFQEPGCGPKGQLDVRAALTAFYSTSSAYKLADALSQPDVAPGTLENLLDQVYDDLRLALRRDLADMFLL